MVGGGIHYNTNNCIKVFHRALGLNTALKSVTIEKLYVFMWLPASLLISQRHLKDNIVIQKFLFSSEPEPKPVSQTCYIMLSFPSQSVELKTARGALASSTCSTLSNEAANPDATFSVTRFLSATPFFPSVTILPMHPLPQYSIFSWRFLPCLVPYGLLQPEYFQDINVFPAAPI